MVMLELAVQYRDTSTVFERRINDLREELQTKKLCETEKMRLRERIETLVQMRYELMEAASFMEHYYDRRFRKNARFTI